MKTQLHAPPILKRQHNPERTERTATRRECSPTGASGYGIRNTGQGAGGEAVDEEA